LKKGIVPLDLDLSNLRISGSGAEPVDLRTNNEFYETFMPYGLRRGIISPFYGLAEATLIVCGNGKHFITLDKNDFENDRVTVLDYEDMDETALHEDRKISTAEDAAVRTWSTVGIGFPRDLADVSLIIVNQTNMKLLERCQVTIAAQ
jgi:acyl-CoA synthetase (AMP-forming)/AMP-acid ligase II